MTDLRAKAEQLRSLHRRDQPLLLPNAWDATSARAVVECGHPVVATTSKAIAEMLGHADGEAAPASEMLAAAGRIAAAVDVPVTVDAEAGYGLPAEALVEELVAIGAVGCNIEDTDHRGDGLIPAEERAEYIAQMVAAGRQVGVPLVINARIDVLLESSGVPVAERPDQLARRARLYHQAGADCVFPIGAGHDDLAALLAEVDVPVNAGLRIGRDSIEELRALGVVRASVGPQLYYAAIAQLRSTLDTLASW